MPKLPPLQVAGTQRASLNPQVKRSAFGVEDGQVAVASAFTKVGEVMEGLAIERNKNEGIMAGIEAQKNSSIALFKAQQEDPVNYAENAKKILEQTRLDSTKGMASRYAEDAFNSKWNSFAASRMVNAYEVQEKAQKQQNIQVAEASRDAEAQNIIKVPGDEFSIQRYLEESSSLLKEMGHKEDSELYAQGMSQAEIQVDKYKISGYIKNGSPESMEMAKKILDESKDKLDVADYEKLKEDYKNKEFTNGYEAIVNTGGSLWQTENAKKLVEFKENIHNSNELDTQQKQIVLRGIDARVREQQVNAANIHNQIVQEKREAYLPTGNIAALDGLPVKEKEVIVKERDDIIAGKLPKDGSEQSEIAKGELLTFMNTKEFVTTPPTEKKAKLDKKKEELNDSGFYTSKEAGEEISKAFSKSISQSQPASEADIRSLFKDYTGLTPADNRYAYAYFMAKYIKDGVGKWQKGDDLQKKPQWASDIAMSMGNVAQWTFEVTGWNVNEQSLDSILLNKYEIDFDDSNYSSKDLVKDENVLPSFGDEFSINQLQLGIKGLYDKLNEEHLDKGASQKLYETLKVTDANRNKLLTASLLSKLGVSNAQIRSYLNE